MTMNRHTLRNKLARKPKGSLVNTGKKFPPPVVSYEGIICSLVYPMHAAKSLSHGLVDAIMKKTDAYQLQVERLLEELLGRLI